MTWAELAKNPVTWGTVVMFVLYVLWSERRAIIGFFRRRQALTEREMRTEQDFGAQARDRLLRNGDYSKTLTERVLGMLETERTERRSLSQQVVDQAVSAQTVSAQAVEVMQDFADISRQQCSRLDEITGRIVTVLEHQERMQSAIWFVLAKYGLRDREADLAEMARILEEQDGSG